MRVLMVMCTAGGGSDARFPGGTSKAAGTMFLLERKTAFYDVHGSGGAGSCASWESPYITKRSLT
jgi:hypothetical protein